MNIILPCYLITPCIYILTPSVAEDPSLHCYCCCFFPYCSSPSQSSWFVLYLNPTNEYAQRSISYQLSLWNSYLGPLNSYQGHIVQQHIFGCQQGMKMSHSYLKLSSIWVYNTYNFNGSNNCCMQCTFLSLKVATGTRVASQVVLCYLSVCE